MSSDLLGYIDLLQKELTPYCSQYKRCHHKRYRSFGEPVPDAVRTGSSYWSILQRHKSKIKKNKVEMTPELLKNVLDYAEKVENWLESQKA